MPYVDISKFWPTAYHGRWMNSEFTPSLVSVIVPTYNRASRLPRALDSISWQTYRPIEVIVVDDGSTDGSEDVVADWAKQHEEGNLTVRYIRQSNRGAPAARNLALVESKGEYIQYMDSDDIMLAGKLQTQIDCMRVSGKDFVWSPLKVLPEKFFHELGPDGFGSAIGEMYFLDDRDVPDAVYVGVYRRALCVAIGPWDESLCCRQDFDYRYRCEVLNPARIFVPETYYVAFEHPDGRLNDRYFTEEGAEALLRVLDNASRCGGHFGVNLNLYGRYFLALRIALGCDRRDLVCRSLDGLKRASPTRRQYWMVKCLALLHAIAGSSMTIRMLDSYSAAQRANAQPNVRGLL